MDAPDPIEIEASKAALRQAMAIRREEIGSLGASQAGTAIADVLSERPEWDDARRVALFARTLFARTCRCRDPARLVRLRCFGICRV